MPVPKKEIDVEKDPTAEWGLVPWFPLQEHKGFSGIGFRVEG